MFTCESCNNPFTPRYVINKKKLPRFCSWACAGRRPNLKRRHRILRKCLECPTAFECTPKSPQKFCTSRCSAKVANRKRKKPTGTCLWCKLSTGRHPGKKVFCSRKCVGMARTDQLIRSLNAGILTYPNLPKTLRTYLINEAKGVCDLCGWGQLHPITGNSVLQIHHRDGCATNNTRANLQVLCPNCHALTPTFGALNRGNGRPLRYRDRDASYH